MAETTGISWTDHTFNPWWGCERVSPACANCYADTLARRYGHDDLWDDEHGFRFFGDRHWAEPLRWNARAESDGVRRRVFCASMADVFEERYELDPHRERLLELVASTPSLDWQFLTKRPEYARDWLAFYGIEDVPNLWLGVSIENQRFTWRADVLREIPCALRFLSCEPLLGSLLSRRGGAARAQRIGAGARGPLDLDGIGWLIVGGESGGRASRPMRPEWARELRDECLDRGIAFHFKQWGSWTPGPGGEMRFAGASSKSGGKVLDGREWCEIPEAEAAFA